MKNLLFFVQTIILLCYSHGIKIESFKEYNFPNDTVGIGYPTNMIITPDGKYVVSLFNVQEEWSRKGLLFFSIETKEFLNKTWFLTGSEYLETIKFSDDGLYLITITDNVTFPISFWNYNGPFNIRYSHSIKYQVTRDDDFVYSMEVNKPFSNTNICIALGLDMYKGNFILTKLLNGTQLENTFRHTVNPVANEYNVPRVKFSPVNESLIYIRSSNAFYVYEFDSENCTLGSLITKWMLNHSFILKFLISPNNLHIYFLGRETIAVSRIFGNGNIEFPPIQFINTTETYKNSFRHNDKCSYSFVPLMASIDSKSRYILVSDFTVGSISFITLDQEGLIYDMVFNTKENECVAFYNTESVILPGGNQVLVDISDFTNTYAYGIYDINPYVLYQDNDSSLWKVGFITVCILFGVTIIALLVSTFVFSKFFYDFRNIKRGFIQV